jgi:predicted hydrocarbon binding protein
MAESVPVPALFYYPNKVGRIILLAMEEILGHNGLVAALNLAGMQHLINNYPPNNLDPGFRVDALGALHQSLEDLYGPRGGRGLATRAGRACFKYGLREFGPVLGVSDLAFRLLPLNMKIKVGGDVLASTFNRFSQQSVRVEEEPDTLHVHIERCPICWGRKTDAPCCQLIVGVLQESLFWVSGGKNFLVEEVACIARGDPACSFHVGRHALD